MFSMQFYEKKKIYIVDIFKYLCHYSHLDTSIRRNFYNTSEYCLYNFIGDYFCSIFEEHTQCYKKSSRNVHVRKKLNHDFVLRFFRGLKFDKVSGKTLDSRTWIQFSRLVSSQ